MGIGWLWHWTDSRAPDALQARNEERSASFHAWWLSVHRAFERLADRVRAARRAAIAGRELGRLSDELLLDVGLRRCVDGTVVAALREPARRPGIDSLPPPGRCRCAREVEKAVEDARRTVRRGGVQRRATMYPSQHA